MANRSCFIHEPGQIGISVKTTNPSIKCNALIQSKMNLVLELRNSMARMHLYLAGIQSPVITKKMKDTLETEK